MSLDLRGADFDKVDPIRARAKDITTKNMNAYIGGRLGMIFDTTSANISKVKAYKTQLDKLGYDSKMLFVSASLDNAQKRNAKRARKLPSAIVKQDWDNAQKNSKELQKVFGRDFVEISNDDDVKSLEAKTTKLYSKLLGWTGSFPSNKTALAWKQAELDAKKTINSTMDILESILNERKVKQDKDIEDRKGTQPSKYYAKDADGDEMSKSTKQKRAAHFAQKKDGPCTWRP